MHKLAIILFQEDTIPNLKRLCSNWEEDSACIDLFLFSKGDCVEVPSFVESLFVFNCADNYQLWDMRPYASVLEERLEEGGYDLIILEAAHHTNALAPLIAERLDIGCLLDVSSFSVDNKTVTAEKLLFGMNITGRYSFCGSGCILTLMNEGALDKDDNVFRKDMMILNGPQRAEEWFQNLEEEKTEQKESFGAAKRIVIAGRGLERDQYAKAITLAKYLDAEVGATRALVQQGIAPMSQLVGISGTLVYPDICLILGASGAAAFAIGIKNSKTIVGVNIEPMAPIFTFCDYGAICDADGLLDELLSQLQGESNEKRDKGGTI